MPYASVHKLNQKQLAVLHELYRFRIATIQQLANELNITNLSLLRKRMTLLINNDLVDRTFEPSYRLTHRPATYHLTKNGSRALRSLNIPNYSPTVLSNISRTKKPSEKFIQSSLGILDIHEILKTTYKDKITLFTASETAIYPYFPKKRPDLYIQYQTGKELKQYFLLYLESNKPMYVNIRRIKDYSEYISEGEWDITNTPSPTLLLVCDRPQLIKRMLSAIYNMDDDVDNELDILIAAKEALLTKTNNAPWINVFEPDVVINLF